MGTAIVIVLGALIAYGMVLEHLEHLERQRTERRMADVALAQDPHLYTQAAVEAAITGALVLTADLPLERAEAIAATVGLELAEGRVHDGRAWQELAR